MRLRNVKGAREDIQNNAYVIPEEELSTHKGKWSEVFGNTNPIMIEVGMGKGRFITELAQRNPDINYLGIEKFSSVLVRGLEKREQLDPQINNLFYIRMEADTITDIFDKDEISGIYLNFSDPWPKDRHAKRRLTSRQFMAKYDKFLKEDGKIEFKTDNRALFDFSVEETNETAFYITDITYDLHNDEKMNEGNIMTEYEQKFSEKGNPIFKMILARRNKNC